MKSAVKEHTNTHEQCNNQEIKMVCLISERRTTTYEVQKKADRKVTSIISKNILAVQTNMKSLQPCYFVSEPPGLT